MFYFFDSKDMWTSVWDPNELFTKFWINVGWNINSWNKSALRWTGCNMVRRNWISLCYITVNILVSFWERCSFTWNNMSFAGFRPITAIIIFLFKRNPFHKYMFLHHREKKVKLSSSFVTASINFNCHSPGMRSSSLVVFLGL